MVKIFKRKRKINKKNAFSTVENNINTNQQTHTHKQTQTKTKIIHDVIMELFFSAV